VPFRTASVAFCHAPGGQRHSRRLASSFSRLRLTVVLANLRSRADMSILDLRVPTVRWIVIMWGIRVKKGPWMAMIGEVLWRSGLSVACSGLWGGMELLGGCLQDMGKKWDLTLQATAPPAEGKATIAAQVRHHSAQPFPFNFGTQHHIPGGNP